MEAPITIVGAGGIGCALGYVLAQAGVKPLLIDADMTKVRWGKAHGLGLGRLPPLAASFVHFDDWQPEPQGTVLLCTKCYDNAAVLSKLPASSSLIPIQNGFDKALKSKSDAIEGIASFVSECYPGRTHTRITRRGSLHLGARRGTPYVDRPAPNTSDLAARLHELADMLANAPFKVRLVQDILPFKYTKLMYNAAISPLAASAGLDNGQLLSITQARQLFFALLQENYQILTGANIALAKIGPFHPSTVQRILRRPAVANFAGLFFYPTLRGTYCSMSGDLPRGRTEIEFYNRHLIDLAHRTGTPCPLNSSVYHLVKRMERERSQPGLHWLHQLDKLAA